MDQHPRIDNRRQAAAAGRDEHLKLVRCAGCQAPIGRVAPGSSVELKCHRCKTLNVITT
jgi:hypothetical protein